MLGLNGVGGGSNPRLGASPRPQSHHVGMTSTRPISLPASWVARSHLPTFWSSSGWIWWQPGGLREGEAEGWAEWQEVSQALNTNLASAGPYSMSPTLKKATRTPLQIVTDFFLHFYLFTKFILRSYEIIKHLVGEGGKEKWVRQSLCLHSAGRTDTSTLKPLWAAQKIIFLTLNLRLRIC